MEHHPTTCADPFCNECSAYWSRPHPPVRVVRGVVLGASEIVRDPVDDVIDRPAHYAYSRIEPIDVIEAWTLPHHLACVVKYLARYRLKGRPLEDLKKARWYLDRWITQLEGES